MELTKKIKSKNLLFEKKIRQNIIYINEINSIFLYKFFIKKKNKFIIKIK